ncbi:MAG: N-6 DNA methylase, partial [Candidatus Hodarchaeota archaeon]
KEQKTSIYDWIKKGYESWQKFDDGTYETLFLIPVATNTKHFKEIIFKYAFGICFLGNTRLRSWSEGREMKKDAPMACCFVYFGHDYIRFERIFGEYGKCLLIERK